MPLITTALFPEIRAALDISLVDDPSLLPDSTIVMGIYQGEAERQVLERVADAQTQVDTASVFKPSIQRAVIYLTAALLAPRLPWILREDFRQYKHERQAVDVPALVADLRGRAETVLQLVTGEAEEDTLRAWAFKLAPGGRGA